MLLRYLVTQYVRQAAEQKLADVVQGAAEQAKTAAQDQPDAAEGDPPPRPEVLFFFALSIESGGLVDLLQDRKTLKCETFVIHQGLLNGRPVGVVETGVGAQLAAQAADDALNAFKPDWAVSTGFAGSLSEELRRGAILMVDEIVSADGERKLDVGLKVSRDSVDAKRGLFVGRLVTVDELIASPKEKRQLGSEREALACDMETMAIGEACIRNHVKLMAIRIISDGVDDRLPPEVEALMDQSSIAGKIGAVAAAVWQRPSSVKDLWALKEEALRATDRLAKFLATMLPQLPSEGE